MKIRNIIIIMLCLLMTSCVSRVQVLESELKAQDYMDRAATLENEGAYHQAAQEYAMVAEQYPGTGNRCIELGGDYAVAACDVLPADIRPGGFISGQTQFAIAD